MNRTMFAFSFGRRLSGILSCLVLAGQALLAADVPKKDPEKPPKMPRIRVAADGQGFTLGASGKRFTPWGFNYARPGRLLDDFWGTEWEEVEADFREMQNLGANVVRVHLQVARFLEGPDRLDAKALDRLDRLIGLAEGLGMYLDITGLGCYRPADVPEWYDPLSEEARWKVQARFWEAVAGRGARSPAVFCYDLMNEPLSPAGKRKPQEWYSGKLFGGFDFLQYIALDRGERKREEIAVEWIRTLTAAIRKHDKEALVTVGLLPSTPKWGHFSGFLPEAVGPELDFVSVHVYPKTGEVAEAVKTLKEFAVGKPLVIEETFPLHCPAADLEKFLEQSRGIACGWVGHYDGRTIADLKALRERKEMTVGDSLWLSWLELFRRLRPEMVGR